MEFLVFKLHIVSINIDIFAKEIGLRFCGIKNDKMR